MVGSCGWQRCRSGSTFPSSYSMYPATLICNRTDTSLSLCSSSPVPVLSSVQVDRQYKEKRAQNEHINTLTSQLILFESRLTKKQKQISLLLEQREQTILRQQKFINVLCNQLTENGLEVPDWPAMKMVGRCNSNSSGQSGGGGGGVSGITSGGVILNFLDSLNDSDSAVVLDDIDSDCNSNSITFLKRNKPLDVTVCRSISDAIETNLLINKYSSGRRSNCFLKRPDILETVYSVEEDSESNQNNAQQQQQQQSGAASSHSPTSGKQQQDSGGRSPGSNGSGGANGGNRNLVERRDKFKNRTEKVEYDMSLMKHNTEEDDGDDLDLDARSDGNFMTITDDECDEKHLGRLTQHEINKLHIEYNRRRISEEFLNSHHNHHNNHSHQHQNPQDENEPHQQTPPNLVNYNRVMLNHRAITRPKDVKYKRINKAKSKSLEELRGKLRQWIDYKTNGATGSSGSSGSANGSLSADYERSTVSETSSSSPIVASQSFA